MNNNTVHALVSQQGVSCFRTFFMPLADKKTITISLARAYCTKNYSHKKPLLRGAVLCRMQ